MAKRKKDESTLEPISVEAKKGSKRTTPKSGSAAKAKTPKRPTKKAKAKAENATLLTVEAIALRAYFLAEARQQAGSPGDATSDWLEAERQLLAELP